MECLEQGKHASIDIELTCQSDEINRPECLRWLIQDDDHANPMFGHSDDLCAVPKDEAV